MMYTALEARILFILVFLLGPRICYSLGSQQTFVAYIMFLMLFELLVIFFFEVRILSSYTLYQLVFTSAKPLEPPGTGKED